MIYNQLKKTVIFSLLGLMVGNSHANQEIPQCALINSSSTLEDLALRAVCISPKYKSSWLEVTKALSFEKTSYAAYLPEINYSVGRSSISGLTEITGIEKQLRIDWALWDNGHRKALVDNTVLNRKIAEESKAQSVKEIRHTFYKLVNEYIYWSQAYLVRLEIFNNFKKVHEFNQKKFNEGLISKLELLRSESEIALDESQVVEAEHQVRALKNTLDSLLGSSDWKVSQINPVIDLNNLDIKRNERYKSLKLIEDVSKNEYLITRSKVLPKINLNYVNSESISNFSNREQIGITLNVPISSLVTSGTEIYGKSIEIEQAKLNSMEFIVEASRSLDSLLAQWKGTEAALESSNSASRSSKNYYEASQAAFIYSAINYEDLMNSKKEYLTIALRTLELSVRKTNLELEIKQLVSDL